MNDFDIVVNTKNPEFITRMMLDSVGLCYEKELYVPTLSLIACFIDGAGDGSKLQYIRNLEKHFPDLCAELEATCFYENYRNGVIHNSSMKPGFGIHQGGKKGMYVVKDTSKSLTSINIDRLFYDFVGWIEVRRTKIKRLMV